MKPVFGRFKTRIKFIKFGQGHFKLCRLYKVYAQNSTESKRISKTQNFNLTTALKDAEKKSNHLSTETLGLKEISPIES